MTTGYLKWMADNTASRYCNDSALTSTISHALNNGAVGVTTNAPLSFEALTTTEPQDLDPEDTVDVALVGDERVTALLGRVVRPIARRFESMYEASEGAYGYVRSQVQPGASADYDKQLQQGLTIAGFGRNVMVKIPGTESGIRVLEELAARGIPTTATVCVSASQILAAADAYERGVKRAIAAGITPAPSTSAFVMGRLQDYLAHLNETQGKGLATEDLEEAVVAVARRLVRALEEREMVPLLMPAAFRHPRQVALLAGAKVEMTIHPKIQSVLEKWDAHEGIAREEGFSRPLDQARIDRVADALPDFVTAFEFDGMLPEQFDDFGATVMTLDGFDQAWQKLRGL
ncbi:transaldolase family protein [Actinomyces mediterranea]|uniref:transaldolase family protein n=1 Tax=Actinomyces mediterranea TaxID=1871028 RepID=UPI0009709EC0|nr:transaldolase family protein [Actinomyces mediterranea]